MEETLLNRTARDSASSIRVTKQNMGELFLTIYLTDEDFNHYEAKFKVSKKHFKAMHFVDMEEKVQEKEKDNES